LLLRKLGETITETLEVIPRQWKVVQRVREKFTCRDCEKISEAPAPLHVIARGWAGLSLLAMILFEKFGQHQPLSRQADRYAREAVPLALSTLADQVGAGCVVLEPILKRIEAHVFAAERLHGDRSGFFQPVNKFNLFHSLSPCRTRTSTLGIGHTPTERRACRYR
jgi:transposase